MQIGTVASLTRYPVKSTGGERVPNLTFEPRGVVGDRCWAVYTEDGGIGSGKTSQRFRRIDGLAFYRSWAAPDGRVLLVGPDGQELVVGEAATDAAVSAALGQSLVVRLEADVPHHDDSPVHLVTTASLRAVGALVGDAVDPQRFRANVVVEVPGDAFVEDAWTGREVAIGEDVVLRMGVGMPRCVMTTAAQLGLPRDPRVLKSLGGRPGVEFGLMVDVVRGGVAHEGDPVTLL